MKISRRSFLGLSAGLPVAVGLGCSDADELHDPGDGWKRGPLSHLLPAVTATGVVVKASFVAPLASAPRLAIGDREVVGEQQDTSGRFFAFRAGGLAPAMRYRLQLFAGADPLCEAWPLSTLPAPDAQPERLRVASFTCAGGIEVPSPPGLFHPFKPAAWRRRLFDLILAQEPDLVIANGDHVYFDLPAMARVQSSWLGGLLVPFVEGLHAHFDPGREVLGTPNETALTTVGDDQIARIYGVRFRSTPIYFVTDDHDYFINDDATPEGTTLPPSRFHAALRNALQRLYLPELPGDGLPVDVPGRIGSAKLALSTHFGEVRYGDLLSLLIYDCGGYLSLGPGAGLVPAAVERWLIDRTLTEDTRHLVHVPSHPMGWTAGKWREWYPDFLESTGSVVAAVERDEAGHKFMWQPGWWRQHQALIAAIARQKQRSGLVVSGDLHALGALRIERSGDIDLSAAPVYTILAGSTGTGDVG